MNGNIKKIGVFAANVNIERHPVTCRPNVILISLVNNEDKHV